MYFLPMGAVMHACGYGAEVAGADALNAAGIAFNLSAATLGNIVGGAVLVALGYWFIFAKKSVVEGTVCMTLGLPRGVAVREAFWV